jgi:hypothetical protein
MKKIQSFIFVFAVGVSLMLSSCVTFAKDIKGDGNLVTKSIPVSKFSKIEIETNVEVNFSQAPNKGSLEFTVDKNLWDFYDIYTKNDILYVKIKDPKDNKRPNPTKGLIVVSSEKLEEIEIAGSSVFNFCTAFTAKELSIDLAGSCRINANKFPVTIEECSVDMAGSCQILLKGTVQQAEIDLAGSGSVKALDCKFDKLSVEIAGSGTVDAYVTKKLDVEIAGSGVVSYKGSPQVSSDIAGSGKVKKI